jgi:hypothetical protein
VQKSAAEVAKPLKGAVTGVFEKLGQTEFAKAIPTAIKSKLAGTKNISVFAALMVTGALAGVGAVLFGARAERKETKAAFDALTHDIGGNKNSAFAKAIEQTYASKKKWGVAKTGLEVGGEAINGALFMKTGTVGFGLIAGSMLPQLCSSLVPESPVLGGYMALKKADAGELKLDAQARVELYKQLIAVMPSVAAHGGQYNRLTAPIAKEMATREMTAKQVVQLLGDEAGFQIFAKEVFEKQAAAAKAKEAAVAAHPHPVAVSKAEGAYHAAEKPAMAVVGHKALEGTVAHTGLHRAPSF